MPAQNGLEFTMPPGLQIGLGLLAGGDPELSHAVPKAAMQKAMMKWNKPLTRELRTERRQMKRTPEKCLGRQNNKDLDFCLTDRLLDELINCFSCRILPEMCANQFSFHEISTVRLDNFGVLEKGVLVGITGRHDGGIDPSGHGRVCLN
jgi:hypothetical protein